MEIPKLPDTLRTEDEIIVTWKGDISKPLVSVRCITYNHAPYIEDAIKGFLIQETDFPIEVWIHDDASTDGTGEIVESYQKQYPRIIKTVLQDENQYSKGNKPGKILIDKCTGKYLAVCEGDDYWTDPRKLQIQVSFLEKNPDYVISGHDAFIVDEENSLISTSKLPDSQKRDFSAKDLAQGNVWVLTMSWVYRNVVKDFAPERNMVRNGDSFFLSILGKFGKSHYHDEIKPAAYRVHPGGVWSASSPDKKLDDQTNTWFWMYRYYKRVGDSKLADIYLARFQRNVFKRSSLSSLLVGVLRKVFMVDGLKVKLRERLGPEAIYRIKRVLGKA